MAKSTRYFRAGTTVNVNVPHATRRAAIRRAAAKKHGTTYKPAKKTTTTRTRTLHEVYKGPRKSETNTALVVGGVALAVGAAFLLWPGTASASQGQPGGGGGGGGGLPGGGGGGGLPGGGGAQGQQGAQGVPGAPGGGGGGGNFPTLPGASTGYAGPGTYRTTAPSGLNIRSGPSSSGASLGLLPIGTTVNVVADGGNGWFRISSPVAGFMCASCPQAPGGPWLARQS